LELCEFFKGILLPKQNFHGGDLLHCCK
jgi:hypothetical protein